MMKLKKMVRRERKRRARVWKHLFAPVCADPYCKERGKCKHGRRMV